MIQGCMKALTHYLFSMGASLCLLSVMHNLDIHSISMAVWVSFSVNYLIDLLGHVSKNGRPVRSWLTHSVVTAPLWGALVATVSITAALRVSHMGFSWGVTGFWSLMGVLVSEEHLFLDSLTQAGVYALGRRIAIAHFRYDNTTLNLGFALLGTVLIIAALGL